MIVTFLRCRSSIARMFFGFPGATTNPSSQRANVTTADRELRDVTQRGRIGGCRVTGENENEREPTTHTTL